jgi:hypothetical protein
MSQPKRKKPFDNYVRYTNIAFQMAAVIGIGAFAGVKIDQCVSWKIPVFTIALSLIAVIAAIYLSVRDFLKKP